MPNQHNPVLQQIHRDQKIYTSIMAISLVAWLLTLGILCFIGYTEYLDYQLIQSRFSVGLAHKEDVSEALKGVAFIAFTISMMVAALTTVILLVRQRSASLQDIQLRLALVEEMISTEKR
ncbi:hypothetical protein [Pseudoalteromonas sp. T1lg48]|uniref:hypothetical protein n=1 Tax=Pseudoalteromonas sp. T1lg48 TaxID=2077100 RepID=UPI000CF5DC48|nr:hypothetical protein [Pseudoalteromonas sp. T1lg48]